LANALASERARLDRLYGVLAMPLIVAAML
jgi:hypothetical protein